MSKSLGRSIFESLEPRLLLDASCVWHSVDMGGGQVYDIHISASENPEQYRNHPLESAYFEQGGVTSLWVADASTHEAVADLELAKAVITIAQDATYLKQAPNLFDDIVGFVNGNELTPLLIDDSGTYAYRCLPGHDSGACGAMLNARMDNYGQRRSYYLDAIVQLVVQAERAAELERSGDTGGLLESALKFTKDASDLASLPSDVVDLAEAVSKLSGVLGDNSVIRRVNSAWGSWYWYWYSWDCKHLTASDLLEKASFAFENLGFVADIGTDALWWVTTDVLVRKPAAQDRYLALKDFVTAYSTLPAPLKDQALVDAFHDFEMQWLHHLDHYGEDLLAALRNTRWDIALDKAMDAASLAAHWAEVLKVGGLTGNVASAVAAGSGYLYAFGRLFEFWQDLDLANVAAASATLGSAVADQLRTTLKDQINLGGPIDKGIVDRNCRLASILSYSGYAFYENLAMSLERSVFDPVDWATYLIGTAVGHDPDAKVRHFRDAASWCVSYSGAKPYENQYILPYAEYYDGLFQRIEGPDLAVVQLNFNPPFFARAGESISLGVVLRNETPVPTDARVTVVVKGRETGYVHALESAAVQVSGEGVVTVPFSIAPNGLSSDTYEFVVQAYSSSAERDMGDNRGRCVYLVGSTKPAIYPAIPPLAVPKGGSLIVDLNQYVYDPDNQAEELSWSAWYFASCMNLSIVDGVATITGLAATGEPATLRLTVRDPSGGWASQDVAVSIFDAAGLSGPAVSPTSGQKGDTFTFSVSYRDPSGIEPEFVCVVVNGLLHNMTPGLGHVTTGRQYVFSMNKLVAADNSFYFVACDGKRHYRTGVMSGPSLPEVHDVAVRDFCVSPAAPLMDQPVEVRARVENLGTCLEQNVQVALKVNGIIAQTSTLALAPGETSAIVQFGYAIPLCDETRNYVFAVEAASVPDETSVADNLAQSNPVSVVPLPGAVSGWVFDQYNIPVEGAIVKVMDPNPTGSYGSTTTDADGYFLLDGLKPSPGSCYTLEASKPDKGSAIRTGVVHTQSTMPVTGNFILAEAPLTLVASGKYLVDPFWFPNGDKLVYFLNDLSVPGGRYVLARVNADGTGFQALTGPGKPVNEAYWGAEVSPDGTKIVFVGRISGGSYGIWMMNANGNGSDAYQLLPGSSTNGYRCPTFSPDGSRIAYHKTGVSGGQSVHWLCTYNLATHQESTLQNEEHNDLSWSPDGKWIAANDCIIDAVTGATVFYRRNGLFYPSWCADSSAALYSDSSWNIWLHYLQSGVDVQITFFPEVELYPVVPRNDGSKLAFVSNKGFSTIGDYGIYQMPFAIPSLYFTNVSALPDPFTPNGDGTDDTLNISYTINRAASVTVKAYDSLGNFVRNLLDNELQAVGAHVVTWDGCNEDGKIGNDEVYFYRLDMHDATDAAISVHGRIGMLKNIRRIGNDVSFARWSPDGSKLVYLNEAENGGTIHVCNPDGSDNHTITTPYRVGRRPAWSVDGQYIIFPTWCEPDHPNQLQLARIRADGTEYTQLTYRTLGSLWGADFPCVSPSGTEIVFDGLWNTDNIYDCVAGMSYDGSNPQPLGGYWRIGAPTDEAPTWSPDGSQIVYAADKTGSGNVEIYLMNADGSGSQLKLTNNPYFDVFPEFTSDGNRLLFGSNRYVGSAGNIELFTLPLDGSEAPRCLAKIVRYGMPSPAGDQIVGPTYLIDLFLSLTKGAIEGRVLDNETLQPLAGAVVYLYQGGSLVSSTLANQNGAYQFWNLQPGTYAVNAAANGYLQSQDATVQTHAWVVSRDSDLALARQPSVAITEIADGTTIGSLISLHSLRETGDVASVKYEWRPVGGQWQEIGTAIYTLPVQWDTEGLTSGDYQVRATALNSQGNEDTSPDMLDLRIDHTSPHAVLTSPLEGVFVSGLVTVSASCADSDVAAMLFQYRRQGEAAWINIGSTVSEKPWLCQWNTEHLLEDGYELRAVAIDELGNVDQNPESVVVSIGDQTPPHVTDTELNGELAQRSKVMSIAITFSEEVTLSAGALSLHNDTTGEDFDLSTVPFNATTCTWNTSGVALTDGYYTGTLAAASVEDTAGNAMASDYTFTFHVLKCDANGDAKVDGGDLAIWQQNYDPLGKNPNTPGTGDWNGDGKIDGGDLALWQQRYNPIGLAAPMKAGATAAVAEAEPAVAEVEVTSVAEPPVAPLVTVAASAGSSGSESAAAGDVLGNEFLWLSEQGDSQTVSQPATGWEVMLPQAGGTTISVALMPESVTPADDLTTDRTPSETVPWLLGTGAQAPQTKAGEFGLDEDILEDIISLAKLTLPLAE